MNDGGLLFTQVSWGTGLSNIPRASGHLLSPWCDLFENPQRWFLLSILGIAACRDLILD